MFVLHFVIINLVYRRLFIFMQDEYFFIYDFIVNEFLLTFSLIFCWFTKA